MSSSLCYLPADQQNMVIRFKEVTETRDTSKAVSTLSSVDWNLERAIERHFAEMIAMAQQRAQAQENAEFQEDIDGLEEEEGDASFMGDSDGEEAAEIEMQDEEDEERKERTSSLLPSRITSIPAALAFFNTAFTSRHPHHPTFLQNTIPEAIEEGFRRQFKPLAFYIHHEQSVAANIFASQVMCNEEVMGVLNEKFLVYPWDVTESSNSDILKMSLEAARLGSVKQIIERSERNVENFPLLILVIRERSTFHCDEIRASDSMDHILRILNSTSESYEILRREEAQMERERRERQTIREQQEAEYQASLNADMERIQKKRQEEEERIQKAEALQKAQEEECFRRSRMAETLPEEPSPNDPSSVTVKFRLPEGRQAMRRFRREEKLQTLADFLSSEGFPTEKFRYFNSDFPKKNICDNFDLEMRFQDVKWPAREQVFVEEIF